MAVTAAVSGVAALVLPHFSHVAAADEAGCPSQPVGFASDGRWLQRAMLTPERCRALARVWRHRRARL